MLEAPWLLTLLSNFLKFSYLGLRDLSSVFFSVSCSLLVLYGCLDIDQVLLLGLRGSYGLSPDTCV